MTANFFSSIKKEITLVKEPSKYPFATLTSVDLEYSSLVIRGRYLKNLPTFSVSTKPLSSMASQRVITKVLGYSLAKTAIDSYTKWFAVEMANRYGDNIRMNAIAPGFFLTEQNRTLLTNEDGSLTERGQLVIKQTPFNRFGHADELVGALVWLLSDASKFVTGTVVNVDGGFSVFGGV